MVRVAKSLYVPIKLLFPTSDAAWPSSMLTLCDTGIFVALALLIAVPRCSKNSFFNCAFLRYTVGLTVTIIMNWLWNGEVKQDGTNQLMGKVWWDWNMYGTKLKKFDECVVHTTNEDDDGGEGDATALPGDCEGGPQYGDGGVDSDTAALEDYNGRGEDDATALPGDCKGGPEDGDSGVDSDAAALEDHNGGGEDDATALPEDCERGPDYDNDDIFLCTRRAVQVLAIRANFPIITIYGFDWQIERCMYIRREGEVQEEGMVDLVLVGPRRIFMAYGVFGLLATGDEGPPIQDGWDVDDPYYFPEEYTETIWKGPGRKLEITYLVIPNALEINVEVRLKFNDLGSISRAVCGNIKVRAPDYGNKSVHLFSCERWRKWSVPPSSTSVLPLSPSVIALPYSWQLELHIDVNLTVITTCDNQEEDKHLKFSLEFTRGIRSQEREFDDGQVEVITWHTLSLV